MIDPAQKSRNSAPSKNNMSLFCRLEESSQQNYKIDKALEELHTIEELMNLTNCTRARINSHIKYIENNCYDRVTRESSGERFRFVLKGASSNATNKRSESDTQNAHYLPTKEDFESAYRALTRLGDELSLDAILDQIEINATKAGLALKSNWRIITEMNIKLWSV